MVNLHRTGTRDMRTMIVAFAVCCTLIIRSAQADPWADAVVSYDPGSPEPGSRDPNAALGEPTRFTSPSSDFGGAVTPFQAPFDVREIVSISGGGHLTVSFDQPVTDDPRNPFGIDLLIFGNSFFFIDPFEVTGFAVSLSSGGGAIELSEDGIDYIEVTGRVADGSFPTLGYADVSGPLTMFSEPQLPAGNELTDFTKPVDPSFDPIGKNVFEIAAGYNGSGGGTGIDIGTVGLSSVSFVRISNILGPATSEIDGLADVSPVPEPTALLVSLLVTIGPLAFIGRRRFRSLGIECLPKNRSHWTR